MNQRFGIIDFVTSKDKRRYGGSAIHKTYSSYLHKYLEE